MFLHRGTDGSGPLLISQGSHAWLAWQLSRPLVLAFNKVNHRLASALALGVVLLVTALGGGLEYLLVATLVGLVCLVWGVRRSTCMASLLIPVLLNCFL